MHELGITRSMVSIVSERAQGQKVLRVTLEVGRLSGMLPEAIRFCFDVCIQGTLLEGAALHIIETEGRGHCAACHAEPVMTAPLGRCPACGEPTLRMVAGTELKIKEMETESCV
ncbi:MAG: hydrogenase maturation nickel metallochaperone HypA [Rubrivivax sp.]|jgi:hydrogenase nickel incorporation protein HypA/HybF|nr:hydrogenase maturation nickel metallochaperone HypA [Rubrivivax sp.]MDP3224812.1 hydrogenase maturation nickel metallochaperone HypA [Rubrivivax sp.]MDP3612760.1 hydrogenase maturation nickel metallochaperone HypA [Rubrivivax sp.]